MTVVSESGFAPVANAARGTVLRMPVPGRMVTTGAVAALLAVASASMAWMAEHRVPHPGNPLAARIAALRGLWPASARGATVAVAITAVVLAIDAAVVWAVASGRFHGAARHAGAAVAALGVLAVCQLLHQGEHVVQVLQLLVTGGNADLSQGVVTRLNQEIVHAVWTTIVWVGCITLFRHLGRNPWLWLLLLAASAHEVEHLYLLFAWLNPGIYLHGGINGVFATHGLIGGPLQRPYLHFLYNLVETVLLLGAWRWAVTRAPQRP